MLRPLLFCAALLLAACSPREPVVIVGQAMGGSYEIKLGALPAGVSQQVLVEKISAEVEAIEQAGSTYRGNSELSRINRQPVLQPLKVSPTAFELIRFAVAVAEESQGAYEPTIGPLVDAWGFGPQVQPEHWLSEDAINALKHRIGYRFIRFDPANSEITRTAEIELNVNGIMQGFAADRVARLLDAQGCSSYLVNMLGEVKARGVKADGHPWKIAVEIPNDDPSQPRAVQKVVVLGNKGMATSGDYRNYYELDGKRISHIINPFTGRPIENKVASVSVLDDSASRADGLTKPLMVMGEKEGVEWAQQKGISALFLVKDGDRFKEIMTGKFSEYVTTE